MAMHENNFLKRVDAEPVENLTDAAARCSQPRSPSGAGNTENSSTMRGSLQHFRQHPNNENKNQPIEDADLNAGEAEEELDGEGSENGDGGEIREEYGEDEADSGDDTRSLTGTILRHTPKAATRKENTTRYYVSSGDGKPK